MKVNKQKKLVEATLGDEADKAAKQFERQADNVVVEDEEDDLERTLTRALIVNRRLKKYTGRPQYVNILLVGEAGVGKTSRVKAWAANHDINLFEVRAAGMDDTDMGGAVSPSKSSADAEYADVVRRLASQEFDDLDLPNSVLFLDEFNRAPDSVRTNLLQLVNDHQVADPRVKGKQRTLKNFLFTIASINPNTMAYGGTNEFDRAELNRFKEVNVIAKPSVLKKFLLNKYDTDIANLQEHPELAEEGEIEELIGKRNLADALLSNKDFSFDSEQEADASPNNKVLSPRSFEALLNDCDGTKDDFIAQYPAFCNVGKLAIIKNILKDYKEADNKATQLLNNHKTKSKVLGSKQDKAKAFLDDLGL